MTPTSAVGGLKNKNGVSCRAPERRVTGPGALPSTSPERRVTGPGALPSPSVLGVTICKSSSFFGSFFHFCFAFAVSSFLAWHEALRQVSVDGLV